MRIGNLSNENGALQDMPEKPYAHDTSLVPLILQRKRTERTTPDRLP